MSDETEKKELSPEDEALFELLCGYKAEKIMADSQQIMEEYIGQIFAQKIENGQYATWNDGKGKLDPTPTKAQLEEELGKTLSYKEYYNEIKKRVPTTGVSLSGNKLQNINDIISVCGNGNDYCMGTYTQSIKDAITANGLEFNILDTAADQRNTCHALNYFYTNERFQGKNICYSIENEASDTTLTKMCKNLYNAKPPKIHPGDLVMSVRGETDDSGLLHAMMFIGWDEKNDLPILSYANNEQIGVSSWINKKYLNKKANNWSSTGEDNQTGGSSGDILDSRCHDSAVVNMQEVVKIMAMEQEREKMLEMGRDAYLTQFLKDYPEYATKILDYYGYVRPPFINANDNAKDPAYAEQIAAFVRGETTEISSPKQPRFALHLHNERSYYYTRANIHNDVTVPRLANIDAENVGTTSRENDETQRSVSQTLQLRGNIENESIGNGIRHTISGNAVLNLPKPSIRTSMIPALNRATLSL
ncbi:MAG: hypothetical protein J5787_04780 [Alphaproteobacteria bacterium]|nr:hypothetical protein [Alphaproteobacteria bacterium]